MTTHNKPMEFCLIIGPNRSEYSVYQNIKPENVITESGAEVIHVIEYTAYEELKRQLKARIELLAEFDDRIGELQRQNEIMADTLEEISMECHPNLTNKDTIFHNKRAREALSKCGKGGSV